MFNFFKKRKQEAFEQEMLAQELEPAQEAVEEEELDLDAILQEFSDHEEPAGEETAPEEAVEEEIAEEAPVEESVEEESAEEETEAEPVEEESAEEEPVEELVEEKSAEEEPVEETAEETVEEEVTSDTVRIQIPADIAAPREDALGDTIRMELPDRQPEEQEVTGDTIKFTGVDKALEDTLPFGPVVTEEQPEKAEPFSEGWEPEYEQPMGEYIPPQPIMFQPKSRLRELKRKLVAGPERRYYELSELGFARLQAAILVSLLVAVLSAGTTVLYAMGLLTERLKLVAFLQLFGMLVAALMGTYQLMDGVTDIFKRRFSLNSLLVLSFCACIADGVFCLMEQRIPCCAAFTVQMTMSLWSTYHRRSIEMGQMDTLRKATRLDSIVEKPDYHDGCTGLLRGEGQVEDFMDHYQEPSTMERITSVYALAACGVSILAGVLAGVLHGSLSFGLQVLAASLLVAVPGTYFITFTRPMAILEKRLHKLGTVLCGWPRISRLTQRAVFPLKHADLFPNGSCKLNGVKFYGSRDPDQVVAYATAVVAADGGGLTPLFEQLLQSRNGRRYSVRNFRIYGNGGIGGEVCGEPVLLGVQEFLKQMGVEVPEGTMVNNAVYVAVDGELGGVFAVSSAKLKSASSGLSTLCGYRGLRPVLVTSDFMLTEEYIRGKFGVNTRRMGFPEAAVRKELAAVAAEKDAPALALSTREGLASFAFAVTGARSVRTASILGLVIHMIGGILGLGMMAVLAVLAAKGLMTPVNMLLYQLVWMIPGLLVTEWTRAI